MDDSNDAAPEHDGIEGETALGVVVDEVEEAIAKLIKKDKKQEWMPGIEVDLGAKQWRPSAVSKDGARILYVALNNEIPKHVSARIDLAHAKGLKVIIALNVPSLYNEPVLEVLSKSDAVVYVLDDDVAHRRFKRRHFLAALADIEVPVSPEQRKALGSSAMSMMEDGSSHEKGRRLEALLAFLFAQVHDLRVLRRNYRTETEEIDIVLQIDNFSGRVWQRSGTPFILVECKNMSKPADQPIMSGFIVKLQTSRRSARIGILVSPKGFTEDARKQEMRFSTDEICVAMMDSKALKTLVKSDDLDAELEAMVSAALLR